MAGFWYSRRKICHGWIHRVDRFLSEIGKIKSRKNTGTTIIRQDSKKKTPALLGYPPSCRDCTRQFQLQLSAFPAGRFHLLRDLSACRFRSPAAVVRPPAWTAPASSSCSCPSAGRLRDSVAGRFHLLSGAVTCRLRSPAAAARPQVVCGIRSPS